MLNKHFCLYVGYDLSTKHQTIVDQRLNSRRPENCSVHNDPADKQLADRD